MKLPLRWLQEFIDLPTTDPAELSEVFTMLGYEVEGVDMVEPDWTEVYVGKVVDIQALPDADKIRICQVDSGQGPTQIVCGAWNFQSGAVVAVARPGAVLPGGFEIGERTIRGVASNGMICSESELGLGDDHDGILVLDDSFQVGGQFSDFIEVPDVVFDLSIEPNRPDAMSMLGMARDLAAHFESDYKVPSVYWNPVPGETTVAVKIEDRNGCRRFSAREISDVSVAPSPFHIRHRLRKAGVRPISNVVDATNYVMLELGHPLHAFDADAIAGGSLVVKRAVEGETLTTLDGEERSLTPDDLIIYDNVGPISMSGTMGGARTEVSTKTRRVIMEAAAWDPPTIMHMARRHGLRSEASSRFERGVDPNLADAANQRASALVAQFGGGHVLEGAVDVVATPSPPATVVLALADVDRLLGPGFTMSEVAAILRRLGMAVEGDDPMTVTVPTFRPDVTRPADLVEEVARIHGYDRFAATIPTGPAGGLSSEQKRQRKLLDVLVGAGLSQAINLPFVSSADLAGLGLRIDDGDLLTIKNPLREEDSKLRPTLLPGLLEATRYNLSHGTTSVGLFEIGKVFLTTPAPWDPRLPDQFDRLAWVVVGGVGPHRMDAGEETADASVSLAIWHLIVEVLGLGAETAADVAPGFHPTRTARIAVGDTVIGHVGELSPSAGRHFGISGRIAAGEIDLAPLLAPVSPIVAISPSVYPHVDFDLSFLVDSDMPAAPLVAATADAANTLLESARVFDEFLDVGDGKKALAIRYRLRAPDRTLTSEEIGEIRATMIASAVSVGAEFRGA